MDAAAGWRRRRAEVEPGPASVRVERRPRPEQQLADVLDPAVDVAADVVRVVGLHLRPGHASSGRGCGRGSRARTARPGPRCASVMSTVGARRDVAVRPGRRLAGGRPGRVPAVRTGRTARTAAPGGRPAATSASAAAISASVPPRWTVAARRGPSAVHGIGSVERPVDLEHARSRSGTARRGGVVRAGSRSPAIASELRAASCRTGRRARGGSSPSEATRSAGDDLAAERPELRGQGVGDGRRAAADHRPADRVGVRRRAPARTTRSAAGRAAASSAPRARRTAPAPARRRNATAGQARRRSGAPAARTGPARAGGAGRGRPGRAAPRQLVRRRGRAARTGPPPGRARRRRPSPAAVAAHGPLEHGRPAAVERVGERARRGGSSSTPRAARSTVRKNGEAERQRQDRRADVVAEPGERQLLRSASRRRSCRRPRTTRTDRPARARVMAAASPFGPGPDDDGIEASPASGHAASAASAPAGQLADRRGEGPAQPSGCVALLRTLRTWRHWRFRSMQTIWVVDHRVGDAHVPGQVAPASAARTSLFMRLPPSM